MQRKLSIPMSFILILAGSICTADYSTDEFKKYAAQRAPSFSEAQLNAFVAGVDVDGNGTISDEEFARRLNVFRRIAEGAALTPKKQEPADRPTPNQAPVTVPLLVDTNRFPVLLITADEIASAWQRYAEWKTKTGRATKIVTTRQIARDYDADSIQEQIRLCVRDHVENHGTRWVVLGGDSLPGGKGLVPGGHQTVHAQERQGIPTDIVYLSATNWDHDGDGVFGEWQDDREAISYPDGSVGLGRIPVRTAEDIAAFTEKVIAYESQYPDTTFAKQMVYTCTDSPAYPKVRKSWDAHVSKVWEGATADRFFSQETPWDSGTPGSYQLSAKHLVELINGRTIGKLHIHGHGHLPAWVLENSTFTSKHIAQLDHPGAYPLITTVSCNTGEYDSVNDPSIVESMLRKPQGGSVAVVAPIRTGKPHFHNRSDFRLMVTQGKLDGTTATMTRYWCHGLGEGRTTGEALMAAKADMAGDARKTAGYHLCICELNLLGDPTLDMRAEPPRTPALSAPKRIAMGRHSIAIKTDTPGCSICVWKGKEVYSITQADENGHAQIEVEPKTEGELLITASGASLNVASTTTLVRAEQ